MKTTQITDQSQFESDADAIAYVTNYLETKKRAGEIGNYQIGRIQSVWKTMNLWQRFLWVLWRFVPGLTHYARLWRRLDRAQLETREAISILKMNHLCDPNYPEPVCDLPCWLHRRPKHVYQIECMIMTEPDLPVDIERELHTPLAPDGMTN